MGGGKPSIIPGRGEDWRCAASPSLPVMTERAKVIPGGDLMNEEMVTKHYNITRDYLWHWVGNDFPAPSLVDGEPWWRRGLLEAWHERRPGYSRRH
jgi:hypothetical protein